MTAFRVIDNLDKRSGFSIESSDFVATNAQLRLFARLQAFLESLDSLPKNDQPTPLFLRTVADLRGIATTKLNGDDIQASEGLSQLEKLEEYVNSTLKRSEAAGAFTINRNEDGSDIIFTVRPSLTVPKIQADLLVEIQKIVTVIKIFLNREEQSFWWKPRFLTSSLEKARWKEYLNQLVGISRLGLENDPAQLELASQQLNALREQIVTSEAGHFKNNYMRRFRGYVFVGSAALLAMYIAAYIENSWTRSVTSHIGAYRNFAILLIGACCGAWLSFGIRKVDILFADLAMLEQDRLDPPVRILFVCGLSAIIGLFFATGAVVVTIGNFDTNFLTGEAAVPRALLIGLLCGVSEQALATAVTRRAGEFLSGVAGARDRGSRTL